MIDFTNEQGKHELLPISKLVLNDGRIQGVPQNPRRPRTDTSIEDLAQSVQDTPEMLFPRPLIVFLWEDKYVVIGGNMRLRACKHLKVKNVPCYVLHPDTTVPTLKAIALKDNGGFGVFDFGEDLGDWGDIDASFGIDGAVFGESEEEGFDEGEEVKHLEAKEDDYQAPDEIKTDIVIGDLFEIGEHRLLCGDSTDSDAVAKLMNGEKADMVFTDPPYNVNYGADTSHPSWGNGKRDAVIKNDNMSGKEFADFIRAAFSNVSLFCDGVIYCFGAQGKDGRIMFSVLDEMFHSSGTIIWVKDSLVLGRSKYHNRHEPCWFGWNKSGATFTEDRTLTNVWELRRPKKSDLHPTMKPIELIETAINHNPKARSVLDLFLGSGSTMVAAHQLARKCYGMELDPKYCQVIADRMLRLDPTLTVKRNGKAYVPKK